MSNATQLRYTVTEPRALCVAWIEYTMCYVFFYCLYLTLFLFRLILITERTRLYQQSTVMYLLLHSFERAYSIVVALCGKQNQNKTNEFFEYEVITMAERDWAHSLTNTTTKYGKKYKNSSYFETLLVFVNCDCEAFIFSRSIANFVKRIILAFHDFFRLSM